MTFRTQTLAVFNICTDVQFDSRNPCGCLILDTSRFGMTSLNPLWLLSPWTDFTETTRLLVCD